MKITLPAIFTSYLEHKDKSFVLRFETRELTDEELKLMRSQFGLEGHLLFADNEIKDEDIPEGNAEVEQKTPSRRLRASLYVLWKQKVGNGNIPTEFETFYKQQMEKAIQKVKNLMED